MRVAARQRYHMTHRLRSLSFVAILAPLSAWLLWDDLSTADDKPVVGVTETEVSADEKEFQEFVKPLIRQHCVRCHNVDNMKSGIRVDQLSATPEDRQLFLWKDILKQVEDGAMPPEEEPQPTDDERKKLTEWIQRTMTAAMARNTQRNGSVRRLTVSQYRNTLRDLLGLDEDLTEVLPPDGISKDGFANNAQTMVLSPLQVEAYFDIAEKSLDLCIVDEKSKPAIQNFRMDLGRKINATPCPDNLVLGANSFLLNNADFTVTQLTPQKPFAYEPFFMQTKFDFIEGYVGNDTIREWRKFDSIYHAVFACLRGSPGYPKGEAFQTVPEGLLLRPAIPNSEIFGASNTYGPMANFKISLRELPDRGNFRVTVKAARYDDALLLNPSSDAAAGNTAATMMTVDNLEKSAESTVTIAEPGIYQIDVSRIAGESKGVFSLQLGERQFAGTLPDYKKPGSNDVVTQSASSFAVMRLPQGSTKLVARYGDNSTLRSLVFSRVEDDSILAQRFRAFEGRLPSVGVYVGLRRDCGSTLARVSTPQPVANVLGELTFSGPINDFPSPEVEKDNVNYLAGIREIGIRSEYTDGRDMPRLLIRSIEFEGPYYAEWPPVPHRNIFIESPHKNEPETYAREIIQSFTTRAFRRPATDDEQAALFKIWKQTYAENQDFSQSIKDALLAVLTAPQFLFLIENSAGPEPEDLTDYELAAKLSYFLWNTAPDQQLLELAAKNSLRESIDAQVERMIQDHRFEQGMQQFASQWLSLDKFDVVSIDEKRFPKLSRIAKSHLRQEPIHFVRHLIQHNLPLKNLIQADFIMADEVVASYYNLGDRTESGFGFVPLKHDNENLGGVLTSAGILAGLSDGREPNPVKRGAWFARKIVAEPPDDPPPNVPKLPEDDTAKLTLRQRLEQHRNQEGCAKCHTGIDPWGLPFEKYDAAGRFRNEAVESSSTLPDGAEVSDVNSLKAHLINDRLDQVAFSYLKHLACYATGRSLTYNELVSLRKESQELRAQGYGTRDLLKFVVTSDIFMKK
jgi:mono/diheme cytochrome c family protein